MDSPAAIPGRLAWRCRRGMKELDVVLTRYLHGSWPDAGDAERAAFERLLETPDPELAAWLLGREQAGDAGIAALVERLRGA